jgi:hypothetical protein
MGAPYENDLDASDTQVDLRPDDPDDEDGRTQPFNEVARAEAAVERSRERVERLVGALRAAVARRTDWRAWIARRPGVFLGAAVVVGFIWGYRRSGGRGSNWR